MKLTFPGANPHPRIEPFDRLDTVVSYFIGNEPDKWHPDVPVWAGVRYVDLYPGVDLKITSEAGGHWTWRLACRRRPERRPESIEGPVEGANCQFALQDVRLRVEGTDGVALNGDALHLTTAVGEFTLPLLHIVAPDGTPVNLTTTQPETNGTDITSPFPSSPSIPQPAIRLSATHPMPRDNPDELLYLPQPAHQQPHERRPHRKSGFGVLRYGDEVRSTTLMISAPSSDGGVLPSASISVSRT